MSRNLLLAWRHVAYYRLKTVILVACLTLVIVLPWAMHLVIRHYDRDMRARAAATPLVIGAKGNRFDLVLQALYFGTARLETVTLGEVEALSASALGQPIPLHLQHTARGFPVVGTTLEYFDFRGLTVAAGTMPIRLGQAVAGARVALALGLAPGDPLFSDPQQVYDITRTYPLKMHIAGVLAPAGTPDDDAVFVDLKTAWIIDGISHGHQDVSRTMDANVVLHRTDDEVRTTAAILEYHEVTPENMDSFHTHASPEELPVSAIVVLPASAKAATILKARYQAPGQLQQMLVPTDVVTELMQRVFAIQRVFNAGFGLVALAAGLFLVLIVLLSQRLRAREMETMQRIGCARGTAFWLQAAELGLVLAISVVCAGVLGVVILVLAPRLGHWL